MANIQEASLLCMFYEHSILFMLVKGLKKYFSDQTFTYVGGTLAVSANSQPDSQENLNDDMLSPLSVLRKSKA